MKPTAEEITMGHKAAEGSPAHCTAAGGEQTLDSGDLIDFVCELPILLPSSSELLNWEEIPPTQPASTLILLDAVSPSARPQPTICGVGSLLVCPSPTPLASSLEDPSTPPQSCDPVAPPWFPASSSPPEPISPPAPLGSLIPPAALWSVVPLTPPRDCTPPAAPRPFVPPALLGSSFPPAPPQSSVALALPQPSGSPPTPRSPKPPATPWPSRSSSSPWLIGSPSLAWAPPPPALPSSVAPPEALSPSLSRLHRGPLSWLWPESRLAPSAPSPFCLLPGSSLCLIHPGPFCLLLGSSLHYHLLGPCLSSSSQESVLRASSGTDLLPALRRPLSPSHIHSFLLLLRKQFTSVAPNEIYRYLWADGRISLFDSSAALNQFLMFNHFSGLHLPLQGHRH
ncbi:Titin [Labeo rohita]|uniref:Titin n=1 Tax=Labeo rohita TaxID=84645 RepID=A0ABQ8MAL7_LABRO|nr:Titin [Labeo rohita]